MAVRSSDYVFGRNVIEKDNRIVNIYSYIYSYIYVDSGNDFHTCSKRMRFGPVSMHREMSTLDTASIIHADGRESAGRFRMQTATAARVSTQISEFGYPEGQVAL